MLCSPLAPEHRAEGGGGELEARAPGETAAPGQSPVSSLPAVQQLERDPVNLNHTPKYPRYLSHGNQLCTHNTKLEIHTNVMLKEFMLWPVNVPASFSILYHCLGAILFQDVCMYGNAHLRLALVHDKILC